MYGARHEPARGARDTAVLLCPSWGMEYMRAHRALYLLAEALAAKGFETLRFDYFGTGDSAGYSGQARVEHWVADIRLAAREILDLSGCSKLCVLGLRLGALLAARSQREGLKVDRFVVWDPPHSGGTWLSRMIGLDLEMTERKNIARAFDAKLPGASHEELLGVPVDSEMAEQLGQLAGVEPDDRTLVVRSNPRHPPPAVAELLDVPDEPYWSNPAWLGKPWLPARSVSMVAQRLDGWLT
jgi:predicted alpha/beta hydrolase